MAIYYPHVLSIPSYIRDTIHLLQNVDELQVLTEALLVAIDVQALYTSIPTKDWPASNEYYPKKANPSAD